MLLLEKHELLLRLRAIEILAYWEGRLVTNRLVAWFGISRQQASADIKKYLSYNPSSLIHDPAVKAYVPIASFTLKFTTGHINEYMELISGLAFESHSVMLMADANVCAVQMPDRAVRPEIVREVVKACRSSGSLKILYASFNNPTLHERVISPHTLVYTGFRWHVRAYCHTNNDFRDFVLSRIDRVPQVSKQNAPLATLDDDWHNTITLFLVPNKNLNEAQRNLIEKDFGMGDGRLEINVRKALIHYALQRYQAAITDEDIAYVRKFPIQLLESDRKKLNLHLYEDLVND